MKFSLSKKAVQKSNGEAVNSPSFPKYTTQLMNQASQNAQATRAKVVGQLSEIFPEFISESSGNDIESWENFYKEKHPEAIETATQKILGQINNYKEAIEKIDEEMVRDWVEDLVINKTYTGLSVQKAVLESIANEKGEEFVPAKPEDESKGIDGYVGNTAYSVKPDTYKATHARSISEDVDVKMVYYTKTDDGFDIEVED
jgi:hypothetical protein